MRTSANIAGISSDKHFQMHMGPDPNVAQQSVTVNIPANQWSQQIMVAMHPSLEGQQRAYKLFVIVNGATLGDRGTFVPPPGDHVQVDPKVKRYDAQLHHGMNTIQIQIIAALPHDQRDPSGPEVEIEKITVFANMTRQ